jgi:hypothetical protein
VFRNGGGGGGGFCVHFSESFRAPGWRMTIHHSGGLEKQGNCAGLAD